MSSRRVLFPADLWTCVTFHEVLITPISCTSSYKTESFMESPGPIISVVHAQLADGLQLPSVLLVCNMHTQSCVQDNGEMMAAMAQVMSTMTDAADNGGTTTRDNSCSHGGAEQQMNLICPLVRALVQFGACACTLLLQKHIA